jgi:hypothetical protein
MAHHARLRLAWGRPIRRDGGEGRVVRPRLRSDGLPRAMELELHEIVLK